MKQIQLHVLYGDGTGYEAKAQLIDGSYAVHTKDGELYIDKVEQFNGDYIADPANTPHATESIAVEQGEELIDNLDGMTAADLLRMLVTKPEYA
ncbi:MAG TPA: hypothetical protein VFK27_07120 [Bacillales bacterium]|nr:hypothetical protein [Bacillales bacterium]